MSKWRVNVIEMNDFSDVYRLEESFDFPTEEIAKAFQKKHNEKNLAGLVEGNLLVARKPFEIQDTTDAS